jgi:hypothetical protein
VSSGFFVTGGAGLGTINASVSGFGSARENGFGMMLGLGRDVRVAPRISPTPFWNGFAVRTATPNGNVGQLGLGIPVH